MIQYRRQLVDLLRELKLPLVAAEIGVAEGLFSRDLLSAGLEKLYSVDAWQHLEQKGDGGSEQEWHDKNYANVLELLKPFGEKSIILKGLSNEMADKVSDNTLGLVYLDAGHDYDNVTKDLESWYGKVVNGGIIAGHDYLTYDGVNKGVKDFCESMGIEPIYTIEEDKIEDAGFWFIKK